MVTDKQLSNRAFKDMQKHNYDSAIKNVRKMKNKTIGTKMELLIIEHEQSCIAKQA